MDVPEEIEEGLDEEKNIICVKLLCALYQLNHRGRKAVSGGTSKERVHGKSDYLKA